MAISLVNYPFLNLLLHPGPTPVLETEWLGFAGSTDFRNALLQTLSLAKIHGVLGWVADDRRLGSVRPKDMEWCQAELLKPLSDLGLRRFAYLESEETLNRLTIDGYHKAVLPDLKYEFQHFTDLAQARAWAAGLLVNS